MFRHRLLIPRVAAALAAATLIAACGGSAPKHRGSTGGSAQTSVNGVRMTVSQANAAMLRFASCMRSHGVDGLPSPVAAPAAFKHSFGTTTPVYRSALGSCQRLIPGQQRSSQGSAPSRRQLDAMLAFAHCLRSHGFTRFPDPTSSAGITHEMLAQAGIDLHQPGLVRAADACAGVTHGYITRAVVAHFIAGR
jgi:hypothetical protein